MPPGQNIKQKQYCNKFSKEVKKIKKTKNKATNPLYWTLIECFLYAGNYVFSHFIFTIHPWDKPPFSDEETEAQKDSVNHVRLYSQNPQCLRLHPMQPPCYCVFVGVYVGMHTTSHFSNGSPTKYINCYLTVTHGFITLQSRRAGAMTREPHCEQEGHSLANSHTKSSVNISCIQKEWIQDLPGCPTVNTSLPLWWGLVQSLVKELRSCMPRDTAKKINREWIHYLLSILTFTYM